MGLSRMTVNKIIGGAFKNGIVRISLNTPHGPYVDLEARLCKAFGLREAIVAPSPIDAEDVRQIVGYALGDYLSRTLERNQVLGLTWGGTIHAAAQALEPRSGCGNVVVSLSGGLPVSTIINPYDNAAMFARALDAKCYYITAPMIVDTVQTRLALLQSEPVRTVLEVARKCDVAVLSASDLTPKTWLLKHGVLSAEMRDSLVRAGAVGCICDQYLDADGKVVKHSINERTISLSLDVVREIPKVVLASGGVLKVPVIRAALRASLVDVLVTDEAAAAELLRDPGQLDRAKSRSIRAKTR